MKARNAVFKESLAASMTIGADNIQSPIDFMVRHLKKNKIVGLGEAHWYAHMFSELSTLLLDENVLSVCPDIVVEMGNAKHQKNLDAFLGLMALPEAVNIRDILLDSIIFPVWLAPQYIQFLYDVRATNKIRKQQGKTLVRVHLTEPPFQWQDIKTKTDAFIQNAKRDGAMFDVLKNRFIDQGKPAILLVGARHLLKSVENKPAKNVAQMCMDYKYKSIVSIWPHFYFKDKYAMASWPTPCIIPINKTDSLLSFYDLSDISLIKKPNATRKINTALSNMLDAYLYLGPVERSFNINKESWQGINLDTLRKRMLFMNEKQQAIVNSLINDLAINGSTV